MIDFTITFKKYKGIKWDYENGSQKKSGEAGKGKQRKVRTDVKQKIKKYK